MIQNYIEKAVNYQRENGTRQLIRASLIKLKNAVFLYEREVAGCILIGEPVEYTCPEIPVTVRPADISDIPELKTLTIGYKKRDFVQWINDKYIFYIAQLMPREAGSKAGVRDVNSDSSGPENSSGVAQAVGDDKKIIGYVCVCPANKSSHRIVSLLKLKDTDYWAVDAYIHPDYRGKGINSAIASKFLAQAKSEGYQRGYGTILFNNYASRRAYALIGEKEIGLFTTITIMGFTFHFLKRNRGYEDYFK